MKNPPARRKPVVRSSGVAEWIGGFPPCRCMEVTIGRRLRPGIFILRRQTALHSATPELLQLLELLLATYFGDKRLATVGVKNWIVRVPGEFFALEPGRPAEHRPLSKRNLRHFHRFHDTLEVPVEFLVYIVQDPIFQTPETGPDRDEALQVREVHRTHRYPEFQLHLVLSFTGNRVNSKAPCFRRLPQTALVLLRDLQPVSFELPNPGRYSEVVPENCFQALGVARLSRHPPREMDLRPVQHRVAILHRIGANSKKASEIVGITCIIRSIEIDALLVGGPGSVKK